MTAKESVLRFLEIPLVGGSMWSYDCDDQMEIHNACLELQQDGKLVLLRQKGDSFLWEMTK